MPAAVTALLHWEGRVTYRLLTLACGLDAALLEAACRELKFKQVAHGIFYPLDDVSERSVLRNPARLLSLSLTRCIMI